MRRFRVARPVVSTFATSAALLLGAGSAALLPIASEGCPGALSAVTSHHVGAATSAPPVQDAAQIAADTVAIDAAQTTVDDANARNQTAQAALDLAEDSLPSTWYYSSSASYAVTSSQSDVDYAQTAVDSARSTLNSDEKTRDGYTSDDYMHAYYDSEVSRDVDRLNDAKRQLGEAKSALGKAKNAQTAVTTASATADQTAAELATAQATLDAAQATKEDHQTDFDVEYRRWKAGEDEAERAADRQERKRMTCAENGRSRLIVSGAVAVVGGALCSYSFVQRR